MCSAGLLGLISSRFGSPVSSSSQRTVVWGKERGLPERLEIEPTGLRAVRIINSYLSCLLIYLLLNGQDWFLKVGFSLGKD